LTQSEKQMLQDLHDAFLSVPVGSPKGAKPLLEKIRSVVATYERASWLTRATVYLLPTLAGLGLAVQAIVSFTRGDWW
jgi:hypothetical protein